MSYLNKTDTEKVASELGLRCLWGEKIKPGDLYLAKRNRPFHVLLTCKINVVEKMFIVCEENDYYFDTNECVKVVEINL